MTLETGFARAKLPAWTTFPGIISCKHIEIFTNPGEEGGIFRLSFYNSISLAQFLADVDDPPYVTDFQIYTERAVGICFPGVLINPGDYDSIPPEVAGPHYCSILVEGDISVIRRALTDMDMLAGIIGN